MTAPVQPTSVTFEEMEEAAAAEESKKPANTDLSAVKFEGDAVPEHLRGKSGAEIIAYMRGLEASLKLSEESRKSAPPPPAPAAPVAEPQAKPPTVEELKALWEKDPMAATAVLIDLSQKQLLGNLEARIAPLRSGGVESARSAAQSKYADEFALFGDQIEAAVAAVPDKSALAKPEAWDDLVAWVRGRSGNLEKLIETKSKKSSQAEIAAAQAAAAAAAPAPLMGTKRTPPPALVHGLDDLEREIARNLGLTEEEYIKWR